MLSEAKHLRNCPLLLLAQLRTAELVRGRLAVPFRRAGGRRV